MKLYFPKRSVARTFKTANEAYKLVDKGTYAPSGRRWAVDVSAVKEAAAKETA